MLKYDYKEPSEYPLHFVEAETKLREAVLTLEIDTPLVRDFLIKTAKEYLSYFGKKGKIVSIHPANFIFVVSAPGWGIRPVRVPVSDFFVGSSQVAQRDYAVSKELWNTIHPGVIRADWLTPISDARPVPKSRHKDTREARKTAANSRSPKQRKLAKD